MLHLRTDWQGIQDTALLRRELVDMTDRLENALRGGGSNSVVDEVVGQLRAIIADDLPEAAGSSIEHDELVFMVRAKTAAARGTVMRYAQLALIAGATPEYCARVREWAEQMAAQRDANVASGKWVQHPPDAPEMLPLPTTANPSEED